MIFLATIIVWFLQHFDFRFNMVEDTESSILAMIAGFMAPIFKPMGLDDWRVVTALFSGFMAKESIVSMMSLLYGGTESLQAALSTGEALAFLTFCLLYTPCVAAVAAVKRERGIRYAAVMVLFQCVMAWICAFVVSLVAQIFI